MAPRPPTATPQVSRAFPQRPDHPTLRGPGSLYGTVIGIEVLSLDRFESPPLEKTPPKVPRFGQSGISQRMELEETKEVRSCERNYVFWDCRH